MSRWSVEKAKAWGAAQPWYVGCNFLPSSAINQLEMWQAESFDPATIDRELSWAAGIGFNAVRVYLHDLVWMADADGFCERIDAFLTIADGHGIRVLLVLFDDCHRSGPQLGVQPLPISGVHNSGWKHSPGDDIVETFHDGSVTPDVEARLEGFVKGVLGRFSGDERVFMWDLYNEPGRSELGDKSLALMKKTWEWAEAVRPSQPLTSCTAGSVGAEVIAYNWEKSDIPSYHSYHWNEFSQVMAEQIARAGGRPVICTEYMAREHGTTFQRCLPVFKEAGIGCFCWGLVAGKSQTHFNWQTVAQMDEKRQAGQLLQAGDPIPEPELWFHDIFRVDGTAFADAEVSCIRQCLGVE